MDHFERNNLKFNYNKNLLNREHFKYRDFPKYSKI